MPYMFVPLHTHITVYTAPDPRKDTYCPIEISLPPTSIISPSFVTDMLRVATAVSQANESAHENLFTKAKTSSMHKDYLSLKEMNEHPAQVEGH